MQALEWLPQLCKSRCFVGRWVVAQVSRKSAHKASDDHVLNSHDINAVSFRLDRGPWAVSWS